MAIGNTGLVKLSRTAKLENFSILSSGNPYSVRFEVRIANFGHLALNSRILEKYMEGENHVIIFLGEKREYWTKNGQESLFEALLVEGEV